jgi:hypothetical protein
MKLDYYKCLGRKLAIVSIVCLSSLGAMAYQGEVFAGAHGGGHGNGGSGNGGSGNGKGQGVGNELGLRSELSGAMNASNTARDHAAHDSAVVLADPNHFDDGHTH